MSIQVILSLFIAVFAFQQIVLALKFTKEDGNLLCNSTGMTLQINFTKFNSHDRPFKIHFKNTNDPACSVPHNSSANLVNGSLLQIYASYNNCGIEVFQRGNDIIYNQSVLIVYGTNPNSLLVYREEVITFHVECTKGRNSTVHLENLGHVNVTSLVKQSFVKVGNASFNIVFNRKTNNFFNKTESSSVLVLGSTMFFELELKSQRNDLKMSPQTCYATNARDSDQKYFLIQNRCPNSADGTVKISTNSSTNQLFHWQAQSFRFFNASDAVYFACDVVVCEISNPSSVCERCPSLLSRKRRDVETVDGQVESAMTVASPLFVLIDEPVNGYQDYTNPAETRNQNIQNLYEDDSGFFSGTKGTVIVILFICLVVAILFVIFKSVMSWRNPSLTRHDVPMDEKL